MDAVAEAWPRVGAALRQARSDPRAAAASAASAARAATARAAARLPALTPRAALLFAVRGPTVRRPRSQLHAAAEADAAAAAAAADADPQLAAARESVRAISELLQSLKTAAGGKASRSRDDGVAERARQALREAREELAAAAELVAAKHRVEALRERAEEARAAWVRGIATQVASTALWLLMLGAAAVAAMRAPAQARLRDAVSTPAVAAVAPAPKHQPQRRFPPPKPVKPAKPQRAAVAQQPDAAAQLAHETMAAAAAAALGSAAFGAPIPPPPPPPAAPRGDDWRSVLEQSRTAVPLGSGVQWRQAGRG